MKPVESGVDDYNVLPPPIQLLDNLSLVPGSITLSQFENTLAERWRINLEEHVLTIRTITEFRTIAIRYAELFNYDYIFVDVSPNLGVLNHAIISTCDAFFMPVMPNLISILVKWKKIL